MSTSGTSVWSLKRDAVINSAMRKLVVLSGGSSPATFEVTNAGVALQGFIDSTGISILPAGSFINSTNASLSGKVLYITGSYFAA